MQFPNELIVQICGLTKTSRQLNKYMNSMFMKTNFLVNNPDDVEWLIGTRCILQTKSLDYPPNVISSLYGLQIAGDYLLDNLYFVDLRELYVYDALNVMHIIGRFTTLRILSIEDKDLILSDELEQLINLESLSLDIPEIHNMSSLATMLNIRILKLVVFNFEYSTLRDISSLVSLEELTIIAGYYSAETCETKWFEPFVNLRRLHINKQLELMENSFEKNTKLIYLRCKVQGIHGKNISHLRRLQELDIRFIGCWYEEELDKLDQLRKLTIRAMRNMRDVEFLSSFHQLESLTIKFSWIMYVHHLIPLKKLKLFIMKCDLNGSLKDLQKLSKTCKIIFNGDELFR